MVVIVPADSIYNNFFFQLLGLYAFQAYFFISQNTRTVSFDIILRIRNNSEILYFVFFFNKMRSRRLRHSRIIQESLLHKAAKSRNVDAMRKLLYDTKCDPNTLNVHGKTAAFMYFISLLNKANVHATDDCLTSDEIQCFVELLWFTYETVDMEGKEWKEVFDMLDYCFQYSDVPIRKLYMSIVDVFITPSHRRRYFVDKILKENLHSDYCLIASMFDRNELLKDTNFVNMRSNFLRELFTLSMANGDLFEEYLSEVMGTGWSFNVQDQSWALFKQINKHPPIATVFNFVKYLIQYEIDFIKFLKLSLLHLPSETAADIAVYVFVPLSNFINAPIDLARVLRRAEPNELAYYNFNETDNVLDDFNDLIEMNRKDVQVVSLKNLARMSVRKYFFCKHTHYKALSLLYSVNIPIELKQFLCYNYCYSNF